MVFRFNFNDICLLYVFNGTHELIQDIDIKSFDDIFHKILPPNFITFPFNRLYVHPYSCNGTG